jgi:hypothetical protein
MAVYDSSSFSIVPAEAGYREPERGLVPNRVSVIYVSVDEPRAKSRRAMQCWGSLGVAARALHRMADRVDDVRRTIERAADEARQAG